MTAAIHPIVEQARAALRRLAEAPPAAEVAAGATREIAEAWGRAPLSIGIGGGIPARTTLVNFLCGDRWLDPHARAVGSAALRVRRGPVTRFRAHRDDGTFEEHVLSYGPRSEAAAASAGLETAKVELEAHAHALVQLDQSIPAFARKRPAGLGVVLLPLYWLVVWVFRKRIAERDVLVARLTSAQEHVDGRERPAKEAAALAKVARDRFIAALRVVASGGAGAVTVNEVEIELAEGPLAEGVEILELTGPVRASARVDAVFVVENDALVAPGRGTTPLAIGAFEKAIAGLMPMVTDARALTIGRRFRTKIDATIAAIDEELARKEESYRRRIEKLEAMRVTDGPAFTEAQLGRLAGQVSSTLQAIVEHASVHLGSELAQLRHEWVAGIASLADAKALEAHVAKLTEQWTAGPRRIGHEVKLLVMGGLGGSARDLYAELVEPLRAKGLPEAYHTLRAAPLLPQVAMLPSLFSETSKLEVAGFFGRLFQSFETRRAEVREKAGARAERLQEVASAELLDAEPLLRAAIREALSRELANALVHQRNWLEAALVAEHAAILADRQLLAPLVAARDAVRDEARRLGELIEQHEARHPAIAISSSAAATASLSH